VSIFADEFIKESGCCLAVTVSEFLLTFVFKETTYSRLKCYLCVNGKVSQQIFSLHWEAHCVWMDIQYVECCLFKVSIVIFMAIVLLNILFPQRQGRPVGGAYV